MWEDSAANDNNNTGLGETRASDDAGATAVAAGTPSPRGIPTSDVQLGAGAKLGPGTAGVAPSSGSNGAHSTRPQPLIPSPPAGIATTCQACNEPRVSRRITCQGCAATFHWSCIGFYEHKYERPGPNWRCKSCRTEPPPKLPAGGAAAIASQPVRAPVSGDSVEVGVKALTTTVPLVSVAQTVIASAPPAAPAPVTTAKAAPAVAIALQPASERVCPVCRKDIGRKRTMDCSVCHAPSHAGCVNVRGAETPKSWVCSDCRSTGCTGNDNGARTATMVSAQIDTKTGELNDAPMLSLTCHLDETASS